MINVGIYINRKLSDEEGEIARAVFSISEIPDSLIVNWSTFSTSPLIYLRCRESIIRTCYLNKLSLGFLASLKLKQRNVVLKLEFKPKRVKPYISTEPIQCIDFHYNKIFIDYESLEIKKKDSETYRKLYIEILRKAVAAANQDLRHYQSINPNSRFI